ncbi:hypothetical protein GCM10011529_06520 [Polymorphobacter glacialis]|uniref:Uncharacterized protein n=1 Tax=Sandarakinorhabdus glacialis TaxID=1614636 RepID=A0A916ZM73_9SPHN|nr:hypothetical protein [Polymorphobacter glacialis]GGE02750.1 hypothetical protein GCM10011529_06520 [Polymorphobacter glacialis]
MENRDEARHLLEQDVLALAFLLLAPLGNHLGGRIDADVDHAGDGAAFVAQRAVRERPPGVLGIAIARHHQVQVVELDGFARQGPVDERRDVGPDTGPDIGNRRA